MINSITSPFFIASSFGVSVIGNPLTCKEKPEWVPLNPLMLTVWFFVSWHICNLLCEETLTAALWIESEVKVFSFFTHSFISHLNVCFLVRCGQSFSPSNSHSNHPPPTPHRKTESCTGVDIVSLPYHTTPSTMSFPIKGLESFQELARNRNYRTTCGGLRSVSMA